MTKFLSIFLSLMLLSACTSSVDKNDIADEGGDDYYGPEETDTLPQGGRDINAVEGPMGINLEQTKNEDGSVTIHVMDGKIEAAVIEKPKPLDGYSAYLLKDLGENAYVAVNPTGLGGYILYTGALELYRVNLLTGAVNQIEYTGYATDVSQDESHLAYVATDEKGVQTITVIELNGREAMMFPVPAEFDEAGDATFSPDGTKLAYQATIKSDGSEETAVFVVDLATENQTEFARQVGLYKIQWQDNERPIVD